MNITAEMNSSTAEKTIENFSSQIEQNRCPCVKITTFFLLSNERLRIGFFGDNRTDFTINLSQIHSNATIQGKWSLLDTSNHLLPIKLFHSLNRQPMLRYAKTPRTYGYCIKKILKLFPMRLTSNFL
jgi:hypothetical protein